MKEKIYAIPVNDAFHEAGECPVCSMKRTLEKEAVAYAMGPSYMEEDVRSQTDALGFCEKHIKQVYEVGNRLGFAWVMKTHMDRIIAEMEQRAAQPAKGKTMFKKAQPASVGEYAKQLEQSCYVCSRIAHTFDRYMDTVFYLYQQEEAFRVKYAQSRGFCTTHYGLLVQGASEKLSGRLQEEFLGTTHRLYLDNMKRVRDDVAWFINKFDHMYADAPWKNAKDSLPRAIQKTASVLMED